MLRAHRHISRNSEFGGHKTCRGLAHGDAAPHGSNPPTLPPGAFNLTLEVHPFTPGDSIVRYSVALLSPQSVGLGKVHVADCAGNACVVPVRLDGELTTGDINCNGAVDYDDIDPFVLALGGESAYLDAFPDCRCLNADCNNDGTVSYEDIDAFVTVLGGARP